MSRLLKKLDTNVAQHGVTFVLATLLDDRFGLKQRRHCIATCVTVCALCPLAVALCTDPLVCLAACKISPASGCVLLV